MMTPRVRLGIFVACALLFDARALSQASAPAFEAASIKPSNEGEGHTGSHSEKLGVKLEAQKVPTEVFVIDTAEKPSKTDWPRSVFDRNRRPGGLCFLAALLYTMRQGDKRRGVRIAGTQRHRIAPIARRATSGSRAISPRNATPICSAVLLPPPSPKTSMRSPEPGAIR